MTVIRNRPTKYNDGVVAASAWVRLNARVLTLLALYALAIGFALYWHATWRDEMQAWLIVRDSADLPALFHNLRYEGHPALWYLLLMPLTRLSRDPALMQDCTAPSRLQPLPSCCGGRAVRL